MTVQITESAGTLEPQDDGSIRVVLISEGQGSSGKYPASTLELAESEGVFHEGLHAYLDHPTVTEAAERPERSVMDLCGTYTTPGRYVSESSRLESVFRPYPSLRDAITERIGDIGFSIRAEGEISESDGQTIERITKVHSVDLVTKAGRGGKALVSESARELLESTRRELIERNGGEYKRPKSYFPQPAITWDEPANELRISPSARLITPIPEPDSQLSKPVVESGTTATAGGNMVDITESEVTQLREKADKVPGLETELQEAIDRADKAEAALAEANRRKEAQTIVAEAFKGIEAPKLKARLVESAVKAQDFDAEAFKAEVTEAAEELAEANSGVKVTGFGDTQPADVVESADFDYDTEMTNIFEGGR